jgi:hypothetical protein
MRQNYFTTATLQNLPPVKHSFHINALWFHVTMTGRMTVFGEDGFDQRGGRWFLRNGKLYSEFLPHIIDIADCFIPKNLAA